MERRFFCLTDGRIYLLMLLFAGFKRGRIKSPALHFARKVFVAAGMADMKIPAIGSINPARIIHDPAYIARKPLRYLTAFAVAKDLFYSLDEFSVYSIFQHIIAKVTQNVCNSMKKRKKLTSLALNSSTAADRRTPRCHSRWRF